MKASEFRIGNWLLIPGLNKYLKVVAIFNSHFRCEDSNCISYEESIRVNYQPIPLTPEILVKCGFENKSKTTDYYFFINGYGWDINIGGARKSMYPCIMGESGLEAFGNELKFLHQLQNLYFALTGTELEVNL
jgi:hypothetical protein